MPLTKRRISPVRVSLNRIPSTVRHHELECVSNGTLANLVRQLSSLSKHAENIFGELFHEALKIEHKTESLSSRVERLTMKVGQLDCFNEEGLVFFSCQNFSNLPKLLSFSHFARSSLAKAVQK